MPATTFAAPILPGKTEAWKKAVAELKGPRKAEYEESRRRMGVTREVVSLQSMPQGDMVIVFLEGSDPTGVVAKYLASNAPFDKWFADAVLKDVHGMGGAVPPPNELFLDWRA
jgi:hypothetical protein